MRTESKSIYIYVYVYSYNHRLESQEHVDSNLYTYICDNYVISKTVQQLAVQNSLGTGKERSVLVDIDRYTFK